MFTHRRCPVGNKLNLVLHNVVVFFIAFMLEMMDKLLVKKLDSVFFFQLSDLAILEEVIRMVLEIINSCVTNTLHHNPNLVYTLLHRRELFAQFRTHPLFHDIIQNIDTVSGCHYGFTLPVLNVSVLDSGTNVTLSVPLRSVPGCSKAGKL